MKYGARNQIKATVKEVKKGDIMAQVRLEIPTSSEMGSVMTVDSLNELNLKPGDQVKVIVKAINVLIVNE